MTNEEVQHLHEQISLSRKLSLGFAGTFVPPMGLLAMFTGWRALQKIDASGGKLAGTGMAWWCFWAGLLQTLTMLPLAWLLLSRGL
jgi:hypothetical protein